MSQEQEDRRQGWWVDRLQRPAARNRRYDKARICATRPSSQRRGGFDLGGEG